MYPMTIDFGNKRLKKDGLQAYQYRIYSHRTYSLCQDQLQVYSEQLSELMKLRVRTPVDRGWAWVVLAAACCCQMLMFGALGSFSVYFVYWIPYFGQTKSYVASVGALNNGCFFLIGPVSTMLTSRYDGRAVVFAGTLLSTLGFALSSLATQVWNLHILFGLFIGTGMGMVAVPVTTAVGLYFNKYRTMALALSFAGGGVGMMVFPPLTHALIAWYGWKGSMLVMAGINLNLAVFGCLLRPIKLDLLNEDQTAHNSTEDILRQARISADDLLLLKASQSTEDFLHQRQSNQQYSPQGEMQQRNPPSSPQTAAIKRLSTSPFSTQRSHDNQSGISNRANNTSLVKRSNSKKGFRISSSDSSQSSTESLLHQISAGDEHPTNSMHSRQQNGKDVPVTSNSDYEKEDNTPRSCEGILGSFQVLRETKYWLFVASIYCWWVGSLIVILMLYDFSVTKGLGRKASTYLLSVNGLSNSVGRVTAAMIGGHPKVNRKWMYSICTLLHGIATALFAVQGASYTTYVVFTVVFGVTYGMKLAIVTAVLVDIFGIENLSASFGFSMFIAGLGSLSGPTLAAYMYDRTGSYRISFLVGGALTVVAVLLFFIVHHLLHKENEKKKREQETLRKESVLESMVTTV